MQEFPKAKVLLNLRDPDSWFDSFMALYEILEQFRSFVSTHEKVRAFFNVEDALLGKAFNAELGRENCIRTFNPHNAKVQERVPVDRLLLFRVEDGWESLCEFLGHPVPNEPFPYVNEGVETIRAWAEKALIGS